MTGRLLRTNQSGLSDSSLLHHPFNYRLQDNLHSKAHFTARTTRQLRRDMNEPPSMDSR